VKAYKHIIFDLDHTLWDFNRNSKETLSFLFTEHQLANRLSVSFEQFLAIYYKTTNALWLLYDKKEISKTELRLERLPKVFATFGFEDNQLAQQIESEYLATCPNKPHLIKGTIELLNFLKSKEYPLHILTNGFKDIQQKKIAASKIAQYFDLVVTSECSGFSKPDKRAYYHLLDQLNCSANECLMIGDNLISDIEGSAALGMNNIFFNPEKTNHKSKPTYEVNELQVITKLPLAASKNKR
jgi:putative hydrolase of the HAD superfamily